MLLISYFNSCFHSSFLFSYCSCSYLMVWPNTLLSFTFSKWSFYNFSFREQLSSFTKKCFTKQSRIYVQSKITFQYWSACYRKKYIVALKHVWVQIDITLYSNRIVVDFYACVNVIMFGSQWILWILGNCKPSLI